jgi:hypothetical protein
MAVNRQPIFVLLFAPPVEYEGLLASHRHDDGIMRGIVEIKRCEILLGVAPETGSAALLETHVPVAVLSHRPAGAAERTPEGFEVGDRESA